MAKTKKRDKAATLLGDAIAGIADMKQTKKTFEAAATWGIPSRSKPAKVVRVAQANAKLFGFEIDGQAICFKEANSD